MAEYVPVSDLLTDHRMRGFHKKVKEVVETAGSLGWRGKFTSNGALFIVSPDGSKTERIPKRAWEGNFYKSIMATITRHGDPALVEHALRVTQGAPRSEEVVGVRTEQTAFGDIVRAVVREPEPQDEPQDEIVHREPFLARGSRKGSAAMLYESKAIEKRTWRSGKVDYACTFPGCEAAFDDPGGVRGHRRKHSGQELPPLDRTTVAVEPDAPPIYTPRSVTRLAREIAEAMAVLADEGAERSIEDHARAMAEFIVERRSETRAHQEEAEVSSGAPTTPEAIVERIRTLLMPEFIGQVRTLTAQVENLTEQARIREEQNERLRRKVSEYRDTLSAIPALIKIDDDDEEVDGGTEERTAPREA